MNVADVATVTLNNGMLMPAMGFGTNEIMENKEGMRDAVKCAIDIGYRLFDTAPIYMTESHVGQAIKEKIAEGVVKREDLFIVSKLWNTKHHLDSVVPACKKSLQELGLDYVDLYLINWPVDYSEDCEKSWEGYTKMLGEVDYTETWRGMEDCVKLGLAKSIGLSNFNTQQINRILETASIKPVVCQDECHVMLSQRRLLLYCSVHDIAVMGYSPLGNPGYLNTIVAANRKYIFENAVVKQLAKKYGKSRAQVALRFLVEIDVIPIPKSTVPEHMAENIDLGCFELTDEEVNELHNFDCEYRICPRFQMHPRYPFVTGYWHVNHY